jgi:hypothetical protein
MNQHLTDPDEILLHQVAAVYDQLDPIPELVREAARAAFELRDLDAELVPLMESLATTAVRGGDEDQLVSFALDGLEIDLGSHRGRHGWQLVGQVTGDVTSMTVQTMAGSESVDVDGYGRFRAAVSARTLCLRLETPDGRQLRTQWVTL